MTSFCIFFEVATEPRLSLRKASAKFGGNAIPQSGINKISGISTLPPANGQRSGAGVLACRPGRLTPLRFAGETPAHYSGTHRKKREAREDARPTNLWQGGASVPREPNVEKENL